MKKITLFSALLFFLAWGSYSQCIRTNWYPDDIIESNNFGTTQQISDAVWTVNHYSQLSNLAIGFDYIFTCESATNKYITVTDWDNNVITHGVSPLTVENITSSQIRLHYSDNSTCGETDTPHSVTLTALLNCFPPLSIGVSEITTTTATFAWESGGVETSWEVLVLEASLPAPVETTIGTVVSGNSEYTTTILEPANEYYFYIRANCGSEFSPWNKLKFVSACTPINLFDENFETTDFGDLPSCWSAIVSGDGISENAFVETSTYSDDTKSVQINRSDSGPNANIILVSPELGNLSLATHRLKFFAFSYESLTLEIGTLNGSTEEAIFNILGEELTIQSGYNEYVVDFTSYSDTDKFIGFRLTSGYFVFLDDIRWEMAPLCPDITQIGITGATINSASFSWVLGGEETAWDVVYGTENITDPNSLTPISPAPTGTPEASISGLEPATTYKVWVRSSCGTPNGNGAWSDPVTFITPCLPIEVFYENFDTTASGELPLCWSGILRGNQVMDYDYIAVNDWGWNAHSGQSAVRMEKGHESTEAILISPNLSTLPLGTHRLKFYASGSQSSLEIGTLNSSTNQAEFITSFGPIELTEEYAEYIIDFASYIGTDNFVGIKLIGTSVNLDDIRWETSPLCPDVNDMEVTGLTTTTASFEWTPGDGVTAWDIVYGETSVTDPNTLTPILPAPTGTATASISGLTPGTSYKVWVRSSCGELDGNGAWMNPKVFTTPCLPIALFYEDFDTTATDTLPACWSMIKRGEDMPNWAKISTVSFESFSEPNAVLFEGGNSSPDNDLILVSPNLSTLATGTHRVKFRAYSYEPTTLEIGSLSSPANNAEFSSWDEVEITAVYTEFVIDFTGYDGTDTFVGFRYKAGNVIFVDNIRWELAPLCPDVQNVSISEITTATAIASWEPSGAETSWQVVYGSSDVTDPSTLTPSELLTETTFSLTDLTPNTGYKVWVRSTCGGAEIDGEWIGPISLRTLCLPTGVPYSENFESAEITNLPACSTSQNLGTGAGWYVSTSWLPEFDTNVLMYSWNESPGNTFFFTRGINLTAGTEYFISYRYGNEYPFSSESLRVLYGTSPNADSMTEELADHPTINTGQAQENSVTFTPETTGIYYFGFNAYSAANQANLMVDDIVIDSVLGTDNFNNTVIKFYPNPVKNVLNLSHSENITNVEVYNLLGQKVFENKLNTNTTQIDMSNLSSGSYLVKVTSDNQTKTIKVIKG